MFKETINQLKISAKEDNKRLSKEIESKNKELQLSNENHLNELKALKIDYEKRHEKVYQINK